VLEQLLSDLHDGIPTVVLVKMIRLQNPWQKFSCKTGTALTIKEQENLVNGLFACKDPNVSLFKTNFHHDAWRDLDKNLHYEKCNRNGKTINYN
jgi:DNA mismatch repair protein MutL